MSLLDELSDAATTKWTSWHCHFAG